MDKKVLYIYTMDYFSAIKKEWNNAICSNLLSKVREIQISYEIAYKWNPKKWYKWTYLQNRNSCRHRKQTYDYQEGTWAGEG